MSCADGGLNDARNAAGTALGIAAPCLAIIFWFAVTYTYREEKKLLIRAVTEQLKPSYVSTQEVIAEKDLTALTKQLEHDSPNSNTEFILPALRDPGAIPYPAFCLMLLFLCSDFAFHCQKPALLHTSQALQEYL